LHCAYSGELKTTWALNYAYHVVNQGGNVLYASNEMFENQIRMNLTCIAANKEIHSRPALVLYVEYQAIRDGDLYEDASKYYHKVANDLISKARDTGLAYGDFGFFGPSEEAVSVLDKELKKRLKKSTLDLVIVDPVDLREQYIDELKCLAMKHTVPVLVLAPFHRGAKSGADANSGQYTLEDLGEYLDAASSPDIITTSYLDASLRADGKVVFGNLKSRNTARFQPFQARVDFPCRTICSIT